MIDVYGILGVEPTATDDEIHRAYKELARKHHPDKGGDPKVMEEITEAYAQVKTPELRRKYEIERNGNEFTVKFKWMEKVFGASHVAENFGNAPSDDRCGERGEDISVNANVPLEDFIFGKYGVEVTYSKVSECLMCSGLGGAKTVNCPRCGATGKIVFRKKEKECPKCKGRGNVVEGECPVCQGAGSTTKECTYSFDLTPGLTHTTAVGKGNEGKSGGPNGDLLIEVNPLPDETRGMEAFLSNEGFPFINITRRVHPEDFILGTSLDFDIYGRLLVVDVPPDTLDFSYCYPVENLFNTGLKALVNVELAPEDPGEWLKDAYSALRTARKAKKD